MQNPQIKLTHGQKSSKLTRKGSQLQLVETLILWPWMSTVNDRLCAPRVIPRAREVNNIETFGGHDSN